MDWNETMNSANEPAGDETNQGDICRVCRCEGQPDRPLFHPCICTGSIKWIHQECLLQWMRYSRKEYCELCSHRFSFTPIYSPDMPRRLLLKDVAAGLMTSLITAVKCWFHYSMVSLAWLGFVPITSYRIYRCLFAGSIESIMSLPWDLVSLENIPSDVFHGCIVVTCTLFSFIGIVWLREQIVNSGPDWLRNPNQPLNNNHLDQPPPPDPEPEGIARAAVDAALQVPGEHEEPPVNNLNNQGAMANEAREEEANWNPIEWDRAAEELTWERLLGLDGSLLFIEHVFWVVSLNTLFIVVFALCPYHLGHLVASSFNREEQVTNSHFSGLIATVLGYNAIAVLLLALHYTAYFLGLQRAKRILGLCYIIIKVALLSIIEIGVLPLICGWWLDICSLSLFDATLKDRDASYHLAPGTSVFIHWLVGMVYVYYFASFILLLREVLRPGVLWFMVNLNDPDFSPMQEMIHLSILHHIRRLLASSVIFGTAVLLMLWVPIKILRCLWPSFLPYTVAVQSETAASELSLELLLLQVILPALLEQSHTRVWMKSLVHIWCKWVAWLLDIHSYLLGDEQQNQPEQADVGENAENENNGMFNGLGAVHQALLMREGRIGVQPYTRPSWFYLRLIGLLILVAISLVIASVTALTLPVWLGRRVMAVWLVGGAPAPSPAVASPPIPTGAGFDSDEMLKGVDGSQRVHELYTAACGTYLCWVTARAIGLLRSWLPQGRAAIVARMRQWLVWGAKSIVTFSLLLGLIPLLFGLLLELVVVIPLRVPLEQTPVVFIWQDWALGVLYTKIACAIILMGPDWPLRRAIERVYRDGVRNMDLAFIIDQVAIPVTSSLGLCLAVPYVIAHTFVPMFVSNPQTRNLIARRLYPSLLVAAVITVVIGIQIRQFSKLYERIKNDKYLVEKRLVNYHHRHSRQRAVVR